MSDVKAINQPNYKKEITIEEAIRGIIEWAKVLLNKWIVIAIITTIGILLGLGYHYYSKAVYTAESIFILDESKSSNSNGGLSALAMLGVGGAGGSEGLYGSDNIIWFYSSRLMIQRTLLTSVKKDNKDILLAEWLIKISDLEEKFSKNPKLAKVQFTKNDVDRELTYEQNIVLSACVNLIRDKFLKVGETKKTENIITVSVTSKDELFAKNFADVIVNNVNSYYVKNKTKGITEEVASLKRRLDSIKVTLNSSMYQTAASVDLNPNANPSMQILRVAPQRKSIDVQTNTAIYIELVKNLETSKLALAKETPIIQVIDAPVLPLPSSKWSMMKSSLIGGGAGIFLSSLFIIAIEIIRRFWNKYSKLINQ